MVKVFVLANQRMRGMPLPDPTLLDHFANTMFSKSNLNSDSVISFQTLLNWVENNHVVVSIFNEFEPGINSKIRENYQIFRKFKYHKNKTFITILKQYHAVYNSHKKMHHVIARIGRGEFRMASLKVNKSEHQSINVKTTPTKLRKNHRRPNSRHMDSILIVNGSTLTQHNVFQLKNYFNSLSNKKDTISSKEFESAFKNTMLRSHSSSLFRFLDDRQKGIFSFKEFVHKLYPSLSNSQLQVIHSWCKLHDNFLIAQKKRATKPMTVKKRILPQTCASSLKNLFHSFDQGEKGYVNLGDLKRVYKCSSTKDLQELVERRARNPSLGMQFKEFAGSILPSEFQIP